MPAPTATATSEATATATSTATPTAIPEMTTAAAAPSDLLAQAQALATQKASAPTLDPNQRREGQEQIGDDRPVTPTGQIPIDMAPVPEKDAGGLNFGNIAGIMLLIVVAILIIVFIVIRRMGHNDSAQP